MSLLKQLLLSVTVAIIVIMAGTLAFSVGSARSYLSAQVQSESENAASAQAITLSQPGNQDPVIRELLLMALFDTGRFQAVQFAEADGTVTFERVRDSSAGQGIVPGWFTRVLPLSTPTAMRDVSDGWKQVGRLTVVGDNSYAYASLWDSSVRQLVLVVVAGALWALLVVMLMRWLRRALNEQVAQQVRAIAEGGPMPVSGQAPVQELASLVSEISHVHQRVKANVHELDARIESLNLELHQDAVTGLANRKYIMNELVRVLQDAQQPGGHVMLLRIRDLASINEAHNRQDVDAWLRECAAEMKRLSSSAGIESQVARLNGSDFVILMPGLAGPNAMRVAQDICRKIRNFRLELPDGGLSRWAFSLTDYELGQSPGEVMSLLDHGLIRAERAGHADVEYSPQAGEAVLRIGAGEGQWRHLLRHALDTQGLTHEVTDRTYEGATSVTRSDASLQLLNDGDVLPGSLFMPIAVRLNMSVECDLRAIELAAQWVVENQRDVVVRVSVASLQQARFWPALRARLDVLGQQPEIARHLVFEVDAFGLVAHTDSIVRLCAEVKSVGAGTGLRRLDAEPAALSRLHVLAVDYVRLTGPLVHELLEGVGNFELLRAIQATAKRLVLPVYADAPSNEAARLLLREYDVCVST